MLQLRVIVASNRPGRKGKAVANWFIERARQHSAFQLEVLDLAEINLPVYDEPNHPVLQQYQHQHTKDWATHIAAADAFVVVTPEYNYFAPPSLINAFDYVYKEWNYKPIAFVSYGGISGGIRSVQVAKQIAVTLKMMPMYEGVALPFFEQFMDGDVFQGNEKAEKLIPAMLDELAKWGTALKTMRT